MPRFIESALLFAILLAGCQPVNIEVIPSSTKQEIAELEPTITTPVVLIPVSSTPTAEATKTSIAYPPPDVQVTPTEIALVGYPAPQRDVSWEETQALLLDGAVTQIYILPSQAVILMLKDGRVLRTSQPFIDEYKKVLEQCGDKCNQVEIIIR